MLRLALFTGMRRGELMKLKWSDVDFEPGVHPYRNPKGGVSQKIPLNDPARDILKNYPQTADYVFVRTNGKQFTNVINKRARAIRTAAGCRPTSDRFTACAMPLLPCWHHPGKSICTPCRSFLPTSPP